MVFADNLDDFARDQNYKLYDLALGLVKNFFAALHYGVDDFVHALNKALGFGVAFLEALFVALVVAFF